MTSISIVLSSDKSEFTTSFSPPIELQSKYGLALVNLETYYSFPNVTNKNNVLRYSTDNGTSWQVFIVPVGTYELNQINDEIKRQVPAINISANLATLKAIVKIDDDKTKIDFNIDNSIRTILGFDKKVLSKGYHESDMPVNILSVNSILIHCDIISDSYENGKKRPVIYSFFPNCFPGEKILEKPINLVYLPVFVDKIYSINIRLTDQNDKPINFRGETITLRLHLKKY